MKGLPHSLRWLTSPLFMRVLWVLFAVLFYLSGQAFTTLLLEPEQFAGGSDWLLAALFPLLIPLFFVVNYYLGCVGGMCRVHRNADGQPTAMRNADGTVHKQKKNSRGHYTRPPGI
ncbi:MAG: hypothetical protein JSW10_11170 [Pseudomonadota bacterium]|nr:MAG: hypothetical protein JSW10_11170 [Pseudomonadota bacterium]